MTGVTQPSPVSPPELDRVVPECPYVGLVPFDESHAPYFFGRQRERDLVVANLTTSRLTLFYAESGVGKSSVLQAGVLPRLKEIAREAYEDLGEPDAAVAYVRDWSLDPLDTIAAKVLAAVSQAAGPVEMSGPSRLSVPWLRKLIQSSDIAAIYLVLDQFEEYLRYHPDDVGDDGLAGELGRILSTRDLQVNVLLSIREDALAGLDRFKGRVPRLYDNYLRLVHLDSAAAREAIERPLGHYNEVVSPGSTMAVEPELIDALLDQTRAGKLVMELEGMAPGGIPDGRDGIETPFLQLVLTQLWKAERASGSSVLRRSTLDELGGAPKIVQTHLRTVMDELSPAQREIAAKVFRYLVTPTGSKNAQTAETLAEWSDESLVSVRELLQSLSAGGQSILRPVQPPSGTAGSSLYEIFHDVMGPAVLDWRRCYVAQQQQQEAARRLDAERAEASRRLLAEREEAAHRLSAERKEARAAAETARHQLRLAWLAAGLAATLLVFAGFVTFWKIHTAQKQGYLTQAATALSYNPVESLRYAVNAYQVPFPWFRNADSNKDARSAVLTAASNPRSSVIAGPKPMMIGMKSTPDNRYVVAYDAHGSVRVIGATGVVERQAKASGLPGTVTSDARTVAVSPDASRVALGTDEGAVAVVDTTTERPLNLDIDSRQGSPITVMWIGTATNGLVLVVSGSGAAATYSPDTGKQIARLGDVVAFDAVPLADEQHIVTSGADKKLRVWDARTGAQIAESSTLNPPAFRLVRYVQSVVSVPIVGLSGGAKPSIVEWNWQAGKDPVWHQVDAFNNLQKIIVDEHAETIMIAQDKEVRAYRLADGSLLGSLPPQADFVRDVASSPDRKWITTAGADGRVLVWFQGHQQSPTAPTYELLGHRGEATQVSYLHDGRVVLSLGIDGTVRRWELPEVSRFEQHVDGVIHMDLSRDGSWLATASQGQDGLVYIIDPHDLSRRPMATVPAGTPLQVVLFDPTDPHRLLTLGRSERVPKLWRWGDDGEPTRQAYYEPPPLPTYGHLVSLAISPDGKTVASGDNQGAIHLWDAITGKLRTGPEFHGTGPAYSIAFDPTGQLLAATESDGIHFWSVSAAAAPRPFSHPHATNLAFDHSGERLVSVAGDGTLKVWTREGRLVRDKLVAHGHPSSNPMFFQPQSGSGELLALGTAGGLVEIWDVDADVTVLLDRHHSNSVNNVVFLPGDGSRLISASDDTTVAQFRCRACADPDSVIREAEEWMETNSKVPY
jgi:WD40 repeat protein